MTAEAAVFTTPPVDMEDFKSSIDTLAEHNQDCIGGGRIARALRNASRAMVQEQIRKLGYYVQNVSNGDENIIRSAGFEVVRRGPRQYTEIPAPLDVRAQFIRKMAVQVRWKRVDIAHMYVLEYCEEELTDTGWSPAVFSTVGKLVIEGLHPFRKYYFRVCAVGSGGYKSNWSEIAMLSILE